MLTSAVTVAHVINWAAMGFNVLFSGIIALLIFIYNKDNKNYDKQILKLELDVKQLEKTAKEELKEHQHFSREEMRNILSTNRQELKDNMEALEKRFDSKLMEVVERIDSKLDSISEDTKKISGLESRIAGAATDIAWLKKVDG